MKPHCVFCPEGAGTTDDHIPPQCFFAKPHPKNLIEVPCCEACRLRDQQHDEFVRNLFVSFVGTENHPDVKSQVAARRNRSFGYAFSQVEKLMKIMRPVEVSTPAGLYIGTAPAFNLDNPVIDRFFERVSRGVLYDAFGQSYFDAAFLWVKNPLHQAPPTCKSKDVADVFSYHAAPCNQEGVFWVIMMFYRSLRILSRLQMAKQVGGL